MSTQILPSQIQSVNQLPTTGHLQIKNLGGTVVGGLTVIAYAGRWAGLHRWKCQCTCGQVVLRKTGQITHPTNKTTSCGQCEIGSNITHAMCKSKEYQAWADMKARCSNPNNKRYKDYGGRGITVCERWVRSFSDFYGDMGECKVGLSLDRVDNDKGYRKSNCRWATAKQQANNKRRAGPPLKLTQVQRGDVRLRKSCGESVTDISSAYPQVSKATIYSILSEKTQ